MVVPSELLSVIRECCKDDAAYERLLTVLEHGEQIAASPSPELLMRQNRFLNMLHQITLNLLKHADSEEALQSLVEITSLVMDSPYCGLFLKDGDVLALTAYTHNQESIKGLRLTRDMNWISWQAHDSRQPVIVKDYGDYDKHLPVMQQFNIRAALNTPILIDEECVGILAFGRTRADYEFTDEDAQHAILLAQMAAVAIDNAKLAAAAQHEIDERKQTEEALRQSGERFRVIVSQMTDSVIVLDAKGRFTYVNPAFERELGLRSEDALGTNVVDHVHVDDSTLLTTLCNILPAHGQILSGREMRFRAADGAYVWLEMSGNLLYDEHGLVSGIIAVGRNVQERRQLSDLRLQEERLRVALQKEQELGDLKTRMMRRISHEFRTPLSVIQTNIDILERYHERLSREDHVLRFDKIRGQIKQLTLLLDEISLFTKGQGGALTLNKEEVDLPTLLRDVILSAQREIGQQRIVTLDAAALTLNADGSLLRILLRHLVVNAILYSPPETPIRVALRKDGSSAVIEVTDQGIGIAPDEQQAIFEPFYRSRHLREVAGIGMGLSVARVIVEAHGGQIRVESQQGAGSTFSVWLPLYPPKV
ncbi:MAG: PAS domain S-box protein [Anaerolinea sp.]|nr:PAS domain S-box protein [Anaerolinea sp.]